MDGMLLKNFSPALSAEVLLRIYEVYVIMFKYLMKIMKKYKCWQQSFAHHQYSDLWSLDNRPCLLRVVSVSRLFYLRNTIKLDNVVQICIFVHARAWHWELLNIDSILISKHHMVMLKWYTWVHYHTCKS